MKSLHTLLAGAIDYAGLFPPAKLDMDSAVRNYAAYRNGEHVWALGRFIVPAGRLSEFGQALDGLAKPAREPWRVSALVGPDTKDDIVSITRFNKDTAGHRDTSVLVDTVEARATTVDEIEHLRNSIPRLFMTYVEIPVDTDPGHLIESIRSASIRAKVRTGGVTTDSFPSGANLARFISTCAAKKVAFKATAGLHHPLRARYRLTYEPDGPQGTMFGFLNLFVAAAVASGGADLSEINKVLDEQSASAFRFGESDIFWDHVSIDLGCITSLRKELSVSFGSCSFTEPIEGLTSLGLL